MVLDMWMRLDTCIRCGTREGELYGSLWLLECRPAPLVLVSRIQLLRECMQARLGVLDYLTYLLSYSTHCMCAMLACCVAQLLYMGLRLGSMISIWTWRSVKHVG